MSTNLKHENMKNVKLFLSTVIAFLVVGISTLNAQQKQSVIISETVLGKTISIEVIKPDYSIDNHEYEKKEVIATFVLKKELDKWIEQGFEIKESNTASIKLIGNVEFWYTVSYVLIKEE
jgi:hypothetical protein